MGNKARIINYSKPGALNTISILKWWQASLGSNQVPQADKTM